MSQTPRLAAILAADVAGYSRPMGANVEGTLEHLEAYSDVRPRRVGAKVGRRGAGEIGSGSFGDEFSELLR
jgi:hypothetical protein